MRSGLSRGLDLDLLGAKHLTFSGGCWYSSGADSDRHPLPYPRRILFLIPKPFMAFFFFKISGLTSLRAIFDKLAKLLFWQVIKNFLFKFLEVVWEQFLMSWHNYCFYKSLNCSQTFGNGTQEKYNNDNKCNTCQEANQPLKIWIYYLLIHHSWSSA